MSQINYSGLKNLSTDEQVVLQRIVEEEANKIEKTITTLEDLQVNIKTHNTKGERKRYLLFLKTKTGKERFAVKTKENDPKKSTSWDITSATRKAMLELQNEVKHKLRADGDEWKQSRWKKLMNKLRGE